MKTSQIGVGSGLTEYDLQGTPTDRRIKGMPQIKLKTKNPDFEKLYYNESLVEIEGRKYPFVVLKEFDKNHNQILIPKEPYVISPKLGKFAYYMLSNKFSPKPHPKTFRGASVGLRGVSFEENRTVINAMKIPYYDFMVLDQGQDVLLRQLDERFPEGRTLRDYEVLEGLSTQPSSRNLTNMLGVGFVVINQNGDYMILEQRRKNLEVEGGTLGMCGGTPEWDDSWQQGEPVHFWDYLRAHVIDEMREELCLLPEECELRKAVWVKDFIRATDIMSLVETSVPMEIIAERCSDSERAQEEHTHVYKVPTDKRTLNALTQGEMNYEVNAPTKVALSLFFKQEI